MAHRRTGGNWLMSELKGLAYAGILFPELKNATLWRETALELLDNQLRVQIYPDGMQYELAPGYHGVVLDVALGIVTLAELNGIQPTAS